MPLVYRIEDVKSGRGPYRSEFDDFHYMTTSHNKSKYHYCPHVDNWMFFGFKNIESLKVWFKGYRSRLNKHGFCLTVYEVKEYYIPDMDTVSGQVYFEKSKASLKYKTKIP